MARGSALFMKMVGVPIYRHDLVMAELITCTSNYILYLIRHRKKTEFEAATP